MLAPTPNPRPSPLPLPFALVTELGPVVMADDPCEAAFSGEDPTGPRKYYRARYYDPKVGRFVSEDPIGFGAGDVNFYDYVFGNPVNRVDPSGLVVQECFRPMVGFPSVSHSFVFLTQTNVGFGLGPPTAWILFTPLIPVPGVIEPDNPYDPQGNMKKNYSCSTVNKSQCVEDCLARKRKIIAANPPAWNMGKFQCNNFTPWIINECKKECGQ